MLFKEVEQASKWTQVEVIVLQYGKYGLLALLSDNTGKSGKLVTNDSKIKHVMDIYGQAQWLSGKTRQRRLIIWH